MQKNIKSAFLLALLSIPHYGAPGAKGGASLSQNEFYLLGAWISRKPKIKVRLRDARIERRSKQKGEYFIGVMVKKLENNEFIKAVRCKVALKYYKKSSSTPEKVYETFVERPAVIDSKAFLYLRGDEKIDRQHIRFCRGLERTGRKSYIKITFKQFQKYLKILSGLFKNFLISKEIKTSTYSFSHWPRIFQYLMRKNIEFFEPKINIDNILIVILNNTNYADKNKNFKKYADFYNHRKKQSETIFSQYFPEKTLKELAGFVRDLINKTFKEDHVLLTLYSKQDDLKYFKILTELFKKFFDKATEKLNVQSHFSNENIDALNDSVCSLLLNSIFGKTLDYEVKQIENILRKICMDKNDTKGMIQFHAILFEVFSQVFRQINSRYSAIFSIDYFEKQSNKNDYTFLNCLTYDMDQSVFSILSNYYLYFKEFFVSIDHLYIEHFMNKFRTKDWNLEILSKNSYISSEVHSSELHFLGLIKDEGIQKNCLILFNQFKKVIERIFNNDILGIGQPEHSYTENYYLFDFLGEIGSILLNKKFEDMHQEGYKNKEEKLKGYTIFQDLIIDYPFIYLKNLNSYLSTNPYLVPFTEKEEKKNKNKILKIPIVETYVSILNTMFSDIKIIKYPFDEFGTEYSDPEIIKKLIVVELVSILKKMLKSFDEIIFPGRPTDDNFDKAIPLMDKYIFVKEAMENYHNTGWAINRERCFLQRLDKKLEKEKKYKTANKLFGCIEKINNKLENENILEHAEKIIRFTDDFIKEQSLVLFLTKNNHYYRDINKNQFFEDVDNIKIHDLPESKTHFFETIFKIIKNMEKLDFSINERYLINECVKEEFAGYRKHCEIIVEIKEKYSEYSLDKYNEYFENIDEIEEKYSEYEYFAISDFAKTEISQHVNEELNESNVQIKKKYLKCHTEFLDLKETEYYKDFESDKWMFDNFKEKTNKIKEFLSYMDQKLEYIKDLRENFINEVQNFKREDRPKLVFIMLYTNGLEIINLIESYMSDPNHTVKAYSSMKLEKFKLRTKRFIDEIENDLLKKDKEIVFQDLRGYPTLCSISESNDKLMATFSEKSMNNYVSNDEEQLCETIRSLKIEPDNDRSQNITEIFLAENSFKRALLEHKKKYLQLIIFLKNQEKNEEIFLKKRSQFIKFLEKEKMRLEQVDEKFPQTSDEDLLQKEYFPENSFQKTEGHPRQKQYFDEIDKLKLNNYANKINNTWLFYNSIISLTRNLQYIKFQISEYEEYSEIELYKKICEIALDILDLTVCYMTERNEVEKPCDKVKKIYHETENFLKHIIKNDCNEESQTFFRIKLDDINRRKNHIKKYFKAIMNNEMVMIYKKNGTIYLESRDSDDEKEEDAAS